MGKRKPRAEVWRPIFLQRLSETANVTRSAKAAGVSRQAAYLARTSNEEFAKDWEDAEQQAIDLLEEEARRRAYEGVPKPVYYQGEYLGETRDYSDVLMIFLLKAHRPTKYRDNQHIEQSGTININFQWADDDDDDHATQTA